MQDISRHTSLERWYEPLVFRAGRYYICMPCEAEQRTVAGALPGGPEVFNGTKRQMLDSETQIGKVAGHDLLALSIFRRNGWLTDQLLRK